VLWGERPISNVVLVTAFASSGPDAGGIAEDYFAEDYFAEDYFAEDYFLHGLFFTWIIF
jgi:hypothetical protein